jgi:nucleoside-diphosphate-sugar epimerase
MQILVTGATGWIGSAVVDELISAGHRVAGTASSETRLPSSPWHLIPSLSQRIG